MSKAKDEAIERQQIEHDKKIATHIGITYDELTELDYSINENTSDDGVIYDIYISFGNDNPKKIMGKIKNLDSNNCVSLGANGLT